MKNHFKKVVAGMLFGAVAITNVAVVATDGLRTLENVKVGGIRIVIDNKEFTCTDANGTVVEPMLTISNLFSTKEMAFASPTQAFISNT